MLSYPAAIPLSTRTLTRLAELLRTRRRQLRSRWRRLDAAGQALLVLAHLRNGDTFTRLAAGFGVGATTAWRYVREAVDLLAALADDLHTAGVRAARLAYAILDGTLVPIDRVAEQKPYYSGCEYLDVRPGPGLTRTLVGLRCLVFDLSTGLVAVPAERRTGARVSR